jgi:hypothetical protein
MSKIIVPRQAFLVGGLSALGALALPMRAKADRQIEIFQILNGILAADVSTSPLTFLFTAALMSNSWPPKPPFTRMIQTFYKDNHVAAEIIIPWPIKVDSVLGGPGWQVTSHYDAPSNTVTCAWQTAKGAVGRIVAPATPGVLLHGDFGDHTLRPCGYAPIPRGHLHVGRDMLSCPMACIVLVGACIGVAVAMLNMVDVPLTPLNCIALAAAICGYEGARDAAQQACGG